MLDDKADYDDEFLLRTYIRLDCFVHFLYIPPISSFANRL